MASLSSMEREAYRLIATRRNASEILFVPSGPNWVLPRIEIPPRRRVAEQLTAEARNRWEFDGYCLFISGISPSGGGAPCVVMESLRQNGNAPPQTCWLPTSIVQGCATIQEEGSAIKESLEELDSYVRLQKTGPFAKPGWLKELSQWVHGQIAPLGLRVTGKFQQFNASPTFSLIRLETDGPAVWFKATGDPNRHELSITATLARLFPGYVPTILGVHENWNAWLSMEASGTSLDDIEDCSEWERVALALADLQIRSIANTRELLDCHCKDLRVSKLLPLVDPYFDRMTEFMAAQEKQPPAPLTSSELTSLRDRLKEALTLLGDLSLPDTVGHIDFNPGNVLVSPKRCVFLDWAEGCVTNPLITFEYLREHFVRSQIKDPIAEQRISAAYLRPWQSLHLPGDLARARTVSPLVAVFAYAVASETWELAGTVLNPALAGYFRSLARRMYREAMQEEGDHE